MDLVQEYWRRAELFRSMASQTTIRQHREAIQKIADAWAKMAHDLERGHNAKRDEQSVDR